VLAADAALALALLARLANDLALAGNFAMARATLFSPQL
jgi:hypothetical protein